MEVCCLLQTLILDIVKGVPLNTIAYCYSMLSQVINARANLDRTRSNYRALGAVLKHMWAQVLFLLAKGNGCEKGTKRRVQ